MCVLLPEIKKKPKPPTTGVCLFLYCFTLFRNGFEEVTLIASFWEVPFGFRSHVSSPSEEGQWRDERV